MAISAIIFETERLIIRKLHESDREAFYDMMQNPNVMNPIPQKVMDRPTSDANFQKHLHRETDSTIQVWSLETKSGDQFIGIVAFLINDEGNDEIGYRLREQFWKQGYGTEVAKGLIEHGFETMNLSLITADVYIENTGSVKILDKFFQREREFFNKSDNCIDRRYKLLKEDWELAKHSTSH
ncbi:MAG: ribosomal-protein-alanine N-acetyltransferase [Flavobacteriaceae bacterium]|jgi:ribosomal-protein-alanine N-acetyltransferase